MTFGIRSKPIKSMGYTSLCKLSTVQIQRKIRAAARNSRNIVLVTHAKDQMLRRNVTQTLVLDCLRAGVIQRAPEPNLGKGSLECRMEHYCGGRNLAVVVALADENPKLIVVTVMYTRR